MNRKKGKRKKEKMKKLMIVAATAAMIGGAEAAQTGLAQVYDFSASLKTTTCKETKVSAALAKYFDANGTSVEAGNWDKGDEIAIRKQATRKLQGVIWGCLCPTIENPGWRKYSNDRYVGGYIFWDPNADDYLRITRTAFFWNVLNRIDTMSKVEGAFTLANDVDGQALYLTGAGFGSVKNTGCYTYVSSISGSLSGFRQPDVAGGCVFCSIEGCVVAPLCDQCADANANKFVTVAYGTWKIKWNGSMAKKLSKTPYLSQIYKFKKAGAAKDVLEAIEVLVYDGVLAKIEEPDGEDFDITAVADLEADDDTPATVRDAISTLQKEEMKYTIVEDFDETIDVSGIIDEVLAPSDES